MCGIQRAEDWGEKYIDLAVYSLTEDVVQL